MTDVVIFRTVESTSIEHFCDTYKLSLKLTCLYVIYCCKNDTFQMKNCDLFLVFAQNID